MNKYLYIDMFKNNTVLQNRRYCEEYIQRIKEDEDLSKEDKQYLIGYLIFL